MITPALWARKRVFLTGHTGFKGSWLSLWLKRLGAQVAGYSLAPLTTPNLFEVARASDMLAHHWIADIRDFNRLRGAFKEFEPEIVFHLAAQSLVRESYRDPIETYATNVMGTAHVLEASRLQPGVRAVIVITSDKCYENRETIWAYREHDPMGGYDPYSSSKGCAELVTSAYARSFFGSQANPCSVASVRAGNVIGGGDWAKDRLMPDLMRGLMSGETIVIRRPRALRPWQHVLEPLYGYLEVAERLWRNQPMPWEAWNFGPDVTSERTVEDVARPACHMWGRPDLLRILEDPNQPHEAALLKLDSTKARDYLGWRPRWSFEETMSRTVDWYRCFAAGEDMQTFSLAEIEAYERACETGTDSEARVKLRERIYG